MQTWLATKKQRHLTTVLAVFLSVCEELIKEQNWVQSTSFGMEIFFLIPIIFKMNDYRALQENFLTSKIS